jgi:vitamin B12 transporter
MGVMALLFFSKANLFAQNISDSITKDSTTVLATYTLFDYSGYDFTSGIRTTTIDAQLFANNTSINALGDALQRIGSVYIRSYGNGMLNGITLRGFGPDRTSVLWNGINVNSAGLGLSDMNLMPGAFFNSIKLVEGSNSTQYGNGAQGGSLLMEYKPNFNNRFNLQVQQEFGSFFTWNTHAQLNYGTKKIQGRSAISRNSSDNNFTYTDKATIGFPLRETVNGNFISYQAIQDLFFKFNRNWSLSLHGWYTYTDRKIPPSMGAVNNHARQFDQSLRLMASLRKTIRFHGIKMQVAYLQDQLHFQTDGLKDSSTIHSGQFQAQHSFSRSNLFVLMSGGNLTLNYSDYKFYVNPVTEIRGNIFVMANLAFRNKKNNTYIKFSGGIRQQFSTHYTSYPSVHLGLDHPLIATEKNQLEYKIGISTAYRMPTLNDLYWVPGGNPNLKPEYSWNVENSWNYTHQQKNWNIHFNLLGYFGRTLHWIQWVPAALGYWAPQNITEVQSAGFEAGTKFLYEKKKWNFLINATYNFNHTTDVNNGFTQLIYVPQHGIKGNMELVWNRISLSIQPLFYSKRYTLSDNTQFIPACFLLNLQAGYQLQLKSCTLGFNFRLNNLTNADYQMILNRPMPGINWNVGVSFYFDNPAKKQNNK